MSRDFYFYTVKATDKEIPAVIHPGSKFIEENELYDIDVKRAAPWMLKIGKRTVIEYTSKDLTQYCSDKYGCEFKYACYLINVGYELHSEDKKLGIVPFEDLKEYEKVKSYEAVIFERELIADPEDRYTLYDMQDKLYTEEELYSFADNIENEYGAEYHYETLYILYKCARLARRGELVWCLVC